MERKFYLIFFYKVLPGSYEVDYRFPAWNTHMGRKGAQKFIGHSVSIMKKMS